MISLEHVGICAADTIKLKDWYIKIFGMKVVYENKKQQPTFILGFENNIALEIFPADEISIQPGKKHQGIRHLAFYSDNIEEMYDYLKNNNVNIIGEINVSSSGAKSLFFTDIEGNIIHLICRNKKLFNN